MSADKEFVLDAAQRWDKVLNYANARESEANVGAIAIALWATMNVDRLLSIASGKVDGGRK